MCYLRCLCCHGPHLRGPHQCWGTLGIIKFTGNCIGRVRDRSEGEAQLATHDHIQIVSCGTNSAADAAPAAVMVDLNASKVDGIARRGQRGGASDGHQADITLLRFRIGRGVGFAPCMHRHAVAVDSSHM